MIDNPAFWIVTSLFAILLAFVCTKAGRERLVFFFLDNCDLDRARTREQRKRERLAQRHNQPKAGGIGPGDGE